MGRKMRRKEGGRGGRTERGSGLIMKRLERGVDTETSLITLARE